MVALEPTGTYGDACGKRRGLPFSSMYRGAGGASTRPPSARQEKEAARIERAQFGRQAQLCPRRSAEATGIV